MDEQIRLQFTQCIENARSQNSSGRVGHVGAEWVVQALEACFEISVKLKKDK